MSEQDIFEVDLYDYVQVLWKRKVTILVIFLAATFTSAILSWFVLPPSYEAKTSLMVHTQSFAGLPNWSADTVDKQSFAGLPNWSVDTYVNIAKGTTVKAKAIEMLGGGGQPGEQITVEDFDSFSEVRAVRDTSIIELVVRRERASDAARIANVWARALAGEVDRLRGREIERAIRAQKATLDTLLAALSKEPPVITMKRSIADDSLMSQIMVDVARRTGKPTAGLSIRAEEGNPVYQELAKQVAEARAALKPLEAWRAMINEGHSGLVRVISPAIAPSNPVAPRRLLNVIVAAVLGLMVGVFIAFGQEWFERSAAEHKAATEHKASPGAGSVNL